MEEDDVGHKTGVTTRRSEVIHGPRFVKDHTAANHLHHSLDSIVVCHDPVEFMRLSGDSSHNLLYAVGGSLRIALMVFYSTIRSNRRSSLSFMESCRESNRRSEESPAVERVQVVKERKKGPDVGSSK